MPLIEMWRRSQNDDFWMIRPKKGVLFPEIGPVKIFLSLTRPHSRMCIRIHVSNLKQKTKKAKKKNKTEDKKQKKLKKKKQYLWKI